MKSLAAVPTSLSGTTDLEQRVLAHEKVLQALIAYMSRTEPRFVHHLRRRFVEPMSTAIREHDYRNSDDYAEEFIRAIILLGEGAGTGEPEGQRENPPVPSKQRDPSIDSGPAQSIQPERVEMRQRSGIWEVRLDGVFQGDYYRKEHALAAAALIKLSL